MRERAVSRRTRRLGWGIVGLLALAAVSAPADAQPRRSMWAELWAGSWSPQIPLDDEDVTFGLRAGRMTTDRVGIETTLGRYAGSSTIDEVTVDYTAIPLDVSLLLYFVDRETVGLFAFAGIGFATISTESDDESVVDELGRGLDDNSFTANFGGAATFGRGSVYGRLDVRGRWYESREIESIDYEVSAAVGLRF